MTADAESAALRLFEQDPSLRRWFEDSYAYAVFPDVRLGTIGRGEAMGAGSVYELGGLIGTATLRQPAISFQLEGDAGDRYQQVIFFETIEALEDWLFGRTTFDLRTPSTAAGPGAGALARYRNGVMVLTALPDGTTFEADLTGQSFSFTPVED
ncbi:MAG: hypothetical protein AAGB51_05220 [Planctomycetota bacterium]